MFLRNRSSVCISAFITSRIFCERFLIVSSHRWQLCLASFRESLTLFLNEPRATRNFKIVVHEPLSSWTRILLLLESRPSGFGAGSYVLYSKDRVKNEKF